MRRLPNASTAFASGLMRVRGVRRQRAFDRGFALSDHADWPALLATIAETGASRVLVTHGWSEALARYLAETRGLETGTIRTAFEGETGELAGATAAIRRAARTRAVKRFCRALRTRSIGRRPPMPRLPRWRRYFRDRAARRRGVGGFFLTGRRLKRVVPSAALREWAHGSDGRCPTGC